MEWARNTAAKREFERFATEVTDPLLRTSFLMTGNAKDAEDLVQETLLKVARRWSRVGSMAHPAAYARRVLINLVLHDAGRRTRAALIPSGVQLPPGCGVLAAVFRMFSSASARTFQEKRSHAAHA